MAENPPLNRIYVLGYSANDRDYPIVSLNADPRVAGYKVPEDLSTCPDKRYPNHVFTGAQPISGDERVRHVWEILPSPWVPFTRYDDDLGPVQGRRRSVKNEGQVASLTADKRTTYEAREGSAIVYTELEETWEIKVDEDGNSLFPIRDRDFYDPSRGPVQERRQLFVPTGDEVGSLENVNGVITQTSYEPYNEFLSVKIVQTYKVDGPQLIGKATDNDGQLVTVTTQRKGALDYIPPNPTATRTVEVSREDAESLVERIVDTPEVFKANTFSVERPDPIPQKFRVAVPIQSSQEIVEGTAEIPTLEEGEISKSEEQRNKFIKRISSTSRDQAVLPQTLTGKTTNAERQEVTVTETLQEGNTNEAPTATTTIESEALGDGNYVITKTEVDEVFSAKTFSKESADPVPAKFRVASPTTTIEETVEGDAQDPTLGTGEIAKSEQQINKFTKKLRSTFRNLLGLPKTILQKATNSEGQLVTVRETLQIGDTTEQPTAKKTVESEAIGDGTYVVRVAETPEVFKAQTFRAEKADLTPQKFRAKQIDTTKEETIEGDAEQPSLGENEFSKTEQQVNKFVKRVTTTERETDVTETLDEEVITPEGQLATRTITLSKGNQTLSPSATVVDGNIEALGDGRTVKTEITVPIPFDAKQESLEKPEVIPPEFRASLQNKTFSEIKAGESVEIPSLAQDELSKTIQRITEHRIRETKTIRPTTEYPPLSGELVDNDLIKVSRVRTVAKGAQTISPSATVSGTVEALGDGFTLKTIDTKAKVFEAKTFSQERPDNIPIEFRVEKPATTKEFNEEGYASEVSLADTEISKSEQQVNEFVKRVITTTRDNVGDVTLSEEQVDQDGVKVTVERQLSKGTQSIEPSETVRGQVQNLGGGYTVKTTLTRDEVLELPSFSVEKPDVVPAAFRSQVPTTTEEKTIAGDAEKPTLSDENISKTERQIDKFLKRTTTVSRPETVSGNLVGEQIENDGIKSKVTRTLSDGPQTITPSATVSGEVEDIGDGLTIKTEIIKEKFFAGRSFSQEKPDNIPVEFRAEKPITIEEFTEEGNVQGVSLANNEISKSEQQVTEFLKRTRTATRDVVEGVTLEGEQIDQDGVKVTVKRTLEDGTQSITPSAKISGQVEAIGDRKTIKTELEKAEVFDSRTLTRQQAFQIPAKFITGKTEEESFVEEAIEANPEELGENGTGIVQSTAQRVTAFTVRKTTRTVEGETSTTEKQLSNSGQEITIESSISDNPEIETGPTIEIARSQAIGGGKFLKEIGKVGEVFDGKQKTFSQPIQIPAKFLTGKVTENSNIEEGREADPDDLGTDGFGIIQSSSQRVNEFTVRKTTTEQEGITLLTEKQLNNEGQEVTVESSILDSSEVESGPTIEFARSQAIGGGKFIQEIGRVENIFDAKQKTKRQAVQVPAKFLNGNQEQESFIEEGTDANPNALGDGGKGVIESTAQRITEHKVRKSTVSQQILNSIIESQTNDAKQKVTVTSSIVDDPEVEPSAITEFVRTQAIGGGKYVKEEGKVGVVFDSLTKSAQKPDTIPERFRVNSPVKRTEEVIEQTSVEDQSLDQTEYSKTEQRLTEFTVQKTTVVREDTFNETNNQRLEENWGIQIPYREYISGSIPSGDNYEGEGLDDKNHLVREYDKSDLESTLGSFNVTIPSSIDLDLPKVLKSVEVNWQKETSTSIENLQNDPIQGQFTSISQQDQGSVSSSLTLIPSFEVKMEDIWGKNLPATIRLFFLKKENLTKAEIRLKAGATEDWPVFKPQSFSTTVFGKSETVQAEGSVSRAIQINNTQAGYGYVSSASDRTKSDLRLIPVSIDIPPFLLENEIKINNSEELLSNDGGPLSTQLIYESVTITTESGSTINLPSVNRIAQINKGLNCSVNFTIPATSNFIPTSGTYLISSSAEPYKFGWFLVRAITFDASILA